MENSKPYKIPKQTVWIAYKKVKANKGSAGVDGMDFEKYEENLKDNLYKLWNRMSSGSYFPKAVKAVEIPKKDGGVRRLGISTIDDRIAQITVERYADDTVVHCRTEREAKQLPVDIDERLKKCKLELHQTKTKIVYCQDKDRQKDYPHTEFDFLGYTFRKAWIKDRLGRLQKNFIASVSKKAEQTLKDEVKIIEIHKKTGSKIDMIAEVLNPILRGWMNYFGRFNRSAMKRALDCVQRRLIKWAMCKYKKFRGHRRKGEEWLSQIRKREPNLFAHWALYGKS